MPTTEEILELSHTLQPWRPDSLTLEFIADPPNDGAPFCTHCADWHREEEVHSNNALDR